MWDVRAKRAAKNSLLELVLKAHGFQPVATDLSGLKCLSNREKYSPGGRSNDLLSRQHDSSGNSYQIWGSGAPEMTSQSDDVPRGTSDRCVQRFCDHIANTNQCY